MTDLTPVQTLALEKVRHGHTFGYVIINEEDLVRAEQPMISELAEALAERAQALNVNLKIERSEILRRYEISWSPCRGNDRPSVLTIG